MEVEFSSDRPLADRTTERSKTFKRGKRRKAAKRKRREEERSEFVHTFAKRRREETVVEESDIEPTNLFLPCVEDPKTITLLAYSEAVGAYVMALSDISSRLLVHRRDACKSKVLNEEIEEQELEVRRVEANYVHDFLFKYGCSHSKEPWYVEELKYKIEGEDVVRKTTLRNQLFWEMCVARWTEKRYRQALDAKKIRALSPAEEAKHFEERALKAKWQDSLLIKGKSKTAWPRTTNRLSQLEMSKAYFILSATWKTVEYTQALDEYVNSLADRMCDFFSYSMMEFEMDSENMRQPCVEVGHFGPDLKYAMMSQMRYFSYLGDLYVYKNMQKVSLGMALEYYKEAYADRVENERRFSVRDSATSYECSDYFNEDVLRKYVAESCKLVAPEQMEEIRNRALYLTYSDVEKEWLEYRNPKELSSVTPESVGRDYHGDCFSLVLKDAERLASDVIRADSTSPALVGKFEYYVLNMLRKLFAIDFDIFQGYVFHREDLYNNVFLVTGSHQPLLIQAFSRYHVYYEGRLYVDASTEMNWEDNYEEKSRKDEERGKEEEGGDKEKKGKGRKCDIYDTFLLWIAIMLVRLPGSHISKSIERTLKTNYAESKKEAERLAVLKIHRPNFERSSKNDDLEIYPDRVREDLEIRREIIERTVGMSAEEARRFDDETDALLMEVGDPLSIDFDKTLKTADFPKDRSRERMEDRISYRESFLFV